MEWPASVETLVRELGKLPGVGRRSALRLAHHLLRCPPEDAENLAAAVVAARRNVHPCARCGNYAEAELCPVCADTHRDPAVVCVVEKPADILAFEGTGRYRGTYHVLGALLSPLDGIGPDQLGIDSLVRRLGSGDVRELVLATPASTEGESTALYLARVVKPFPVRVTRLARGLPVGGELEFADALTVARALEGRIPL